MDTTRLKQAILSELSCDAQIVLHRISMGKTNEEITAWSEDWNFTAAKINMALQEIYRILDIESIPEQYRRAHAAELYNAVKEQFFPKQANKDNNTGKKQFGHWEPTRRTSERHRRVRVTESVS